MSKIGIYSHPRSGSTMLYEIMAEQYPGLREGFGWRTLLIEESDRLAVKWYRKCQADETPNEDMIDTVRLDKRAGQTREKRLELFKKYHHQDYLIKVHGNHLNHDGVRNYVIEHYQFIAIERRNALDAILSGIIAAQHNFWSNRFKQYDDLSLFYKPFTAKFKMFRGMARSLADYYKYKPLLNITKTLVYEDIMELDRNTILAELDMEPSVTSTLPLEKLISFKDKAKLIENYDEVLGWFEELAPKLPVNRRGV